MREPRLRFRKVRPRITRRLVPRLRPAPVGHLPRRNGALHRRKLTTLRRLSNPRRSRAHRNGGNSSLTSRRQQPRLSHPRGARPRPRLASLRLSHSVFKLVHPKD